ncbi:GGDEF domain-containing protein [Niveibacterium sp. SC-1]|uniref:GGDEF domain-containing protein n=1 Tax=Niveibacterium sp. SC-1 TaxID=3135646 RepID=UPI00311F71B5
MSQATLFLGAIEAGVLALALFLALAGRMREGQSTWAIALALLGLAAAIQLLDDWLPDIVIDPASALLCSAALLGMRDSLARFTGRRRPRFWFSLPPLVALSALVPQLTGWAGIIAGGLLAIQAADCVLATRTLGQDVAPRIRRLLGTGFLIGALAILATAVAHHAETGGRWPRLAGQALMLAHVGLLLASLGFAFAHASRARIRAQRLAALDALTELFNRRSILELGEREFLRSVRSESAFSILMLAPDNLRAVVERHGHLAGDRLLAQIAGLLGNAVRGQDLCGRYSDEEFCVVLPDTGHVGAMQLAQRLRENAMQAGRGPDRLRGRLSVGVASRIDTDTDPAPLLARAEAALHRAQDAGGDRVEGEPEPLS